MSCKDTLCDCQSKCALFDNDCFESCYHEGYKVCELDCACGGTYLEKVIETSLTHHLRNCSNNNRPSNTYYSKL